MIRRSVCLLTAALLLYASGGASGADGFVGRDGARLVLDGREYRAIGMNTPDLFASYAGIFFHLRECFGTEAAARHAMTTAVEEAGRHRIAFLRFYASGFWPKDMKLYFDSPDRYWARMDELMQLCRKNRVRLVPSVFFHVYLWPLLCDEDYRAIADPKSKTYAAMHKYATELVSRYKNDPNILAWELGNEIFLSADLNMEGRPAVDPHPRLAPSARTNLTQRDSLTTATILKFYADMTAHIRRIDPNHMVTSGDAGPRTTSVSLRKNFPVAVWTQDTPRENLASLFHSQPEPLAPVSIHHYGSLTQQDPAENLGAATSLEALRMRVRAVHAAQSPVFVGELGNTEPKLRDDHAAGYILAVLDVLESERASLCAIWAWHLRLGNEHNVTAATHPELVRRIGEFNRKHAALP
jgi:mannan endo-1,4-beta-mannosidase